MIRVKKTTGFLLIFLTVLVSSCEDFLDSSKKASFTDENYYADQETAEELIIANYDIFQAAWPITYAEIIIVPGDYRSDDVLPGGDPNPRDIELWREEIAQASHFADNPIVENIWTFYFSGLWRANTAIEKISKIPDEKFDEGKKEQLLAEAKFFRAYHYSFLVKIFGDVPLFTSPPSPDEYESPRADKEKIFDLIRSDLRYSIKHLPLKGVIDPGRVTRGTAIYLLTNVLVYQAGTEPKHPNWQQAYNISDTLINGVYSGQYRLLDDYQSIWMEGNDYNDETIFELAFHDDLQQESAAFITWLYPRFVKDSAGNRQGSYGWGNNCPTQDLVDEFETHGNPGDTGYWEDPRLQASVWREGDIVPLGRADSKDENDSLEVWLEDTPTGYYTKKYWLHNEPENFNGPINPKIFRYSDLILFHAEAAYYLGKEDKARTSVNLVRERARQGNENILADLDASYTGKKLLDAIWHERRVELCMEHHRFYDLVRQNRVGKVLRDFGIDFVDGKHEVLPIPLNDMDLNPNLVQNQGY